MEQQISRSMDQQISRSMDRQIVGSVDRWIDGSVDRWIGGSMDQQINRSMDQQIDGSLDQQIDESVDRWISGSVHYNIPSEGYFSRRYFFRLSKRFAKNLPFPKNESKIKRARDIYKTCIGDIILTMPSLPGELSSQNSLVREALIPRTHQHFFVFMRFSHAALPLSSSLKHIAAKVLGQRKNRGQGLRLPNQTQKGRFLRQSQVLVYSTFKHRTRRKQA